MARGSLIEQVLKCERRSDPPVKLDEIDLKILHDLQAHGHITNVGLARRSVFQRLLVSDASAH